MLTALPYHQLTTGYFRQQPQVWQFFSNHRHKADQLKQFKADLLKSTYKFDEIVDASLYEKVILAKERLGLSIQVTIYQAQDIQEINASVLYIENEAHIVFSGKLIQLLSDEELLAIIGHELTHIQLYTQMDGEVEVADRIITAIANNQGSTSAHYETARLFKLYTEIFCDRGAYLVTGHYAPIISSLVKIATGLETVNADSFIKQAEEIFAIDSQTKTSGISHPENFIRARAIWLWHTKGSESIAIIQQMIEGSIGLDELDLFGQQQLSLFTLQIIQFLLNPTWMQTPETIALAKQYFPGLELTLLIDKATLGAKIENIHINLQDYLAYVLYDFATAAKELEDVPLGYCFALADELNLGAAFAKAVKKERKLTDKKTSLLKKKTLGELQLQNLQTA